MEYCSTMVIPVLLTVITFVGYFNRLCSYKSCVSRRVHIKGARN